MAARQARSPDRIEAGQAIASARASVGRTQEDLGRAVGVRGSTVLRWEKQGIVPQARHRVGLARELGLELQALERMWGLEPGPELAPVVQLSRSPRQSFDLPRTDEAAPTTSDEAVKARFVDALLTGLKTGTASNREWLSAAQATANILGVPWASTADSDNH